MFQCGILISLIKRARFKSRHSLFKKLIPNRQHHCHLTIFLLNLMNSSHINLCILNIIFLLEYTLVNVFVTGQILVLHFLRFLNLIIHELGSREVEIENQPTLQILT